MNIRRVIAALSSIAILSTFVVSTASAEMFTDVSDGDYWQDAVEALVDAGGYDASEDTYGAADDATRGFAANAVLRLTGYGEPPVASSSPFTDVALTHEFANEIVEAYNQGIVGGKSEGIYAPEETLLRDQFAKLVVEALELELITPSTPSFSDVPTTLWSYGYVETAYHYGLITGYGDERVGTFGPGDTLNRAEAATMANREPVDPADPVDPDPEEPVVEGGDLEVEISDDTPETATIPGAVENALVAKYDFTAGDEDVRITSLKFFRAGLNADGSVVKVALFTEEGVRVSKAKAFSSGDDMANVTLLNGGFVVDAGETVTLSVIAEIGVSTTFSGESFYMSLVDEDAVFSTAENVDGDFPVDSELMGIGSVDAGELQVLTDGVPADVKVGQQGVKITKFKLKNNDSTKNIEFSGITFKEEGSIDEDADLANFVLYLDGDEVASVDNSTGKYVSFKLDNPYLLKASKQISAYVKADILGGASRTMYFQVDSDLDVMAEDMTYRFGAKITATSYNAANDNTSASERVDIEAGEVSVVALDAVSTDIRQNKTDVILGTLQVTTNAGKDLELQKLEINIENTNASVANDSYLDDILENVEIYVEGVGTFDLAGTGTGGIPTDAAADDFTENDLGIALEDGETVELVIRADIRNLDQSSVDLDMTKVDLVVKVSSIGGSTKSTSDMYIIETEDDNAVTDITPSALTFKTLNGMESSATVTKITQSSVKTVVIGATAVEGLVYELETGNASGLTFDGATALVKQGAYSATDFEITTVALTTNSLNIDGLCVVTFTDGGTDDLDCSDDLAVVDSTVYDTAIEQAGRISLLTGLADYRLTAGAATNKFRLVYDNAAPIAGNPTVGAAATEVVDPIGGTFALTATAINVGTAAFANNASNSYVTQVKLYKDSVDEANLLDTVSGAQLSSGVATFEGFEEELSANGTFRHYITVDVVDDENQQYDVLKVYLNTLALKDDDSDPVTAQSASADLASGNPVTSDRTVAIVSSGSLSVSVDNTDPSTDRNRLVLGDTTSSEFVASFELTAINEAVLIKDIRISEETGETLASHVSEIILYKADKTTEIASKSVTSDEVNFKDINYLVDQGTENIFVKVVAHKMGKDEAGAEATTGIELDFQAINGDGNTSVEGGGSGKPITAGSGVATATGDSNTFLVVPVRVSAVSFVSDGPEEAEAVTATLLNNVNTVAIVKVVTDNSTNSDVTDGGSLETLITQLKLKQTRLEGSDQTLVTAYTIEKIGGADGSLAYPTSNLDTVTWTDTTPIVVTATSFGDTGITVTVTDNGDGAACSSAVVTGGTAITVACDITTTTTATHADLETALEATGLVTLTVTGGSALALNSIETLLTGSDYLTFDMDTLMTSDHKISNGGTSYYMINATVTKDGTNDNDDFVKLEMDDLSSDNVIYTSDDTVGNNTAVADTRFSYTSLSGTTISE